MTDVFLNYFKNILVIVVFIYNLVAVIEPTI